MSTHLADLATAYLTGLAEGTAKEAVVLDSFVDAAGSVPLRLVGRREVERV